MFNLHGQAVINADNSTIDASLEAKLIALDAAYRQMDRSTCHDLIDSLYSHFDGIQDN